MRRTFIAVAGFALLLGACREGDGPVGPGVGDVPIFLESSPAGAAIFIDGFGTDRLTPDTLLFRRGDRNLMLRLDSGGVSYSFASLVRVPQTDSVLTYHVPLAVQCAATAAACFGALRRHYEAANMRFAVSALGSLFHWGNANQGLFWPAGSSNNYVTSGIPVMAALANGTRVSMGVYDHSMLAGRPAPTVHTDGGRFTLRQTTWIVPPSSSLVSPVTLRGIEVEQEIIADNAVEGVLVVRLTFRNISDDPLVYTWAPHIPPDPVTYTNAYIGFALDPDIGLPGDDWLSYDVDLDMAFAYDSNFVEQGFTGDAITTPGLVGLRVLRAPEGSTVLLNGWGPLQGSSTDWSAGTQTQVNGYGMLTGTSLYNPFHPHPRIGHLPPAARDIRIAVTAGPLTLAPGAEAEVVIAIGVAAPTPGTYTPNSPVAPGDPLDVTRSLYSIASQLRARMQTAEALLP